MQKAYNINYYSFHVPNFHFFLKYIYCLLNFFFIFFQGLVLGSFFYGYWVLQVPGAWIAMKLGATRIFGYGVFLSSLMALLTPVATRYFVFFFSFFVNTLILTFFFFFLCFSFLCDQTFLTSCMYFVYNIEKQTMLYRYIRYR